MVCHGPPRTCCARAVRCVIDATTLHSDPRPTRRLRHSDITPGDPRPSHTLTRCVPAATPRWSPVPCGATTTVRTRHATPRRSISRRRRRAWRGSMTTTKSAQPPLDDARACTRLTSTHSRSDGARAGLRHVHRILVVESSNARGCARDGVDELRHTTARNLKSEI